jgi:hypothetical protein
VSRAKGADHNRTIDNHAVNLKYRLRNIETNRANLARGRLSLKVVCRWVEPPAMKAKCDLIAADRSAG